MFTNEKMKSPENGKAVKTQFEHNDGSASFSGMEIFHSYCGDIPLLLVERHFNAALWNWERKREEEKLIRNWFWERNLKLGASPNCLSSAKHRKINEVVYLDG